jgi:hypothetical protein
MRTWMRSKVRLLFITCAVLLAIPAIALADNAVADGDGVTPITDNPTMAFGNVGCNVASTNKALIAISRNGAAGSTNVFKNSSTVTVTAAASGNAELSAAMDSPNTISIPSTWSTTANNTLFGNVSSTVTVNSSTPGSGSGTVTFTASGVNSSNNPISRTDTVNVTWTTGSCDTTAPSVSSIAVADANPTNTTDPLDWTVTFSESVTGVDAADFNLVNTGLGGSPAITGVSGSGDTYTVTASSGSGSGTLGLNLTDNDSIKDAANNPLGGTGSGNGSFTGDAYVIDRAAPTMTGSALKGPDFTAAYTANSWTNQSVRVTFACADTGGSGLTETSGNDVQNFATETDTSGTTATSGGTCADNAGNTAAAATFGPIKIDKTDPNVSLNGGPADGQSYFFGDTPAAPTCDASDALSQLAGPCSVSGYSSAVGTHTVTATATDMAGNENTASSTYTVKPYTLNGFYQPIDMNDTVNTVKNGSTVPVKFELFKGATELTSTSAVTSIKSTPISCASLSGDPEDAIETVATGGTSLRYDTTAGQFIYNWTTPKGATQVGKCYSLTMTAADSSTITALFKLK